jgi:Sulfotransferase family
LPGIAGHNMLKRMQLTTIDESRPPLPIRLFNRVGAALEKIGFKSNSLSPAVLIETAKRRNGFDDFGGGEFFEPLSRLLEACQRQARLNLVGRLALRSDVTRTLCNRLSIERDRQRYPGIASQEIHAPLFIVGLPRSGTTLMHTLLAADPEHRAPLTWEVMSPSPPTSADIDLRIRHAQKGFAALRWLAPNFESVHAIGAELPQECVSLMSPSFMSDQFDTMFYVPAYRAWFLKQDSRPAYEFHRRFLQHLQQRTAGGRWILKAPAHMFAAKTLLSIYPDARFVQTHREPIVALASVSSLITILRRIFSDHVDPIQIGRDAVDYWSEALTSFMRERDQLPSERICDLQYADIRRDPIAAAGRIYEYFGWNLSRETEERMRQILAEQAASANGNHRYDPAQFGLHSAERFSAYCDRFDLSPRHPTEHAGALVSG